MVAVALKEADVMTDAERRRRVEDICRRAREAATALARASTAAKDRMLAILQNRLTAEEAAVLAENAKDADAAAERGRTKAFLDRLRLPGKRFQTMVEGVRVVRDLRDPVGGIIRGETRPNGLRIEKVRIPIGVLAVIYESRPNVTIDAIALAVKSGNAIVLRGGSDAARTNRALFGIARDSMREADLPPEALGLVDTTDRGAVDDLLGMTDYIDVVIPRGRGGARPAGRRRLAHPRSETRQGGLPYLRP